MSGGATSLIAAVRDAVAADPVCGGRISASTMDFIEATITGSPERRAAIGAAQQAAEVAAELLRFADEGSATTRFPFDGDPVEKIAEAARSAAIIERDHMAAVEGGGIFGRDDEGIAKLDKLIAACSAFLEGWA